MATNYSSSRFGQLASSPFAQSTFGKPAASTFGAAPTFGAQQAAPSLFGSNTAQPQTSGLFGGASTSTGFGATTTTQPAFGNFAQPQQNTSIFGATQPQANSSSLFGQPTASSAFGSAVKRAGMGTFGATAGQPSTSLFGQSAASTSTSGFGTFGQAAPTTTSVFGSTTASAFGQPANAAAAAKPWWAKYQPTIGTDTLMKDGQAKSINTKHQCITAMKEYEGKSLDELRMEDYLQNRKGPLAEATLGFGFGTTTQPAGGTGLFGATSQPSIFGQTAVGTTENKSAFGSTSNPFGQLAATGFELSATEIFRSTGKAGFGATDTCISAMDTTAVPAFGSGTTAGQQQQNASANSEFGDFVTHVGGVSGTMRAKHFGAIPSYIVYLFVFLILLSFLSFVLRLLSILSL